jgi:ribonuclease P protein component
LRLRRHQRLRTAEVAAVLAAGRRYKGTQYLTMQARGNGLDIARIALIIPKRHLPRAVDRNRVKRLLREWFRTNQAHLKGNDVLLRLTSPIAALTGQCTSRLLGEAGELSARLEPTP